MLHDNNYHYIIAGRGDQKERLEKTAKVLGVNLHLLGFRKDVAELYKAADLFILPSYREGLNVSLMEAISSGCPSIASKIRGNIDVLDDDRCFDPSNCKEIARIIEKKINEGETLNDDFKLDNINNQMISLYQKMVAIDKNVS